MLASTVCRASIFGDVNRDGKVSIADVTLMIRILNYKTTTPQLYDSNFDLNADKVVDQGDLDTLISILLGMQQEGDSPTAIDLGLSVKWASCNLGASSPEEVGNYYAWGELSPKANYSEASYLYYSNSQYTNIGSNICHTRYDAATAAWGDEWQMPTLIDINQLLNKCTWTSTTQGGQKGYLVTGPNGNSIFLPMTGCKQGTTLLDADDRLYYWCGMSSSSTSSSAYCINNSGYSGAWTANRTYGFPIRAVKR